MITSSFENSFLADSPFIALRLNNGYLTQLANDNIIKTINSINNNDGTPIVPSDGVFAKDSFRFNGGISGSSGTYIRVNKDSQLIPPGAISFMLVLGKIRNNTPTTDSNYISVFGYSQYGGYNLQMKSDGKVYFRVFCGSTPYEAGFDRNLIKSSGSIMHATCDLSILNVYLDGSLVATYNGGSPKNIIAPQDNIDLLIGVQPSSNNTPYNEFIDCDIAYYAMYQKCLTSLEIANHVAAFSSAKSLSGSAKIENSTSVPSVMVTNLSTFESVMVTPDADGSWSASVPPGEYMVTASGPAGYRPLTHGPVSSA